MDWYQKLYVGEKIKDKKDRIIRQFNRQDETKRVYFIVTALGSQNQLEILSSEECSRRMQRTKQGLIVGLAATPAEAAELVRQMAEEVYLETGYANLKEYFITQQYQKEKQKG